MDAAERSYVKTRRAERRLEGPSLQAKKSQRKPAGRQKLEEEKKGPRLEPSRKQGPRDTLTSNFQAPDGIRCLGLHYGRRRKLWATSHCF